jgi:hypothetical protein
MKSVDRKKARALAEARDKLRKDTRQGKITKTQAKNKAKRKRA